MRWAHASCRALTAGLFAGQCTPAIRFDAMRSIAKCRLAPMLLALAVAGQQLAAAPTAAQDAPAAGTSAKAATPSDRKSQGKSSGKSSAKSQSKSQTKTTGAQQA